MNTAFTGGLGGVPGRDAHPAYYDGTASHYPSYPSHYQNNGAPYVPSHQLHSALHGNGAPAHPHPHHVSTGTMPVGQSSSTTAQSFYFRKRGEKLNWRAIGSVQMDRLIRDVDVQTLQDILENVTFCDIELEDLRYTDPNFVKLFLLAQLIIEYLLHSQEYLNARKSQADDLAIELQQKVTTITADHQKLLEEVQALRKENRNLNKTVYAYQVMSKFPGVATGNTAAIVNKCLYCPKIFQAQSYLEAHLLRRHPDKPFYLQQQQAPESPPPETAAPPQSDQLSKLTETIDKLSAKLAETEARHRDEMQQKLARELEERQSNMEHRFDAERQKYEQQIQTLKESLRQELAEQQARLEAEKQAHIEKQQPAIIPNDPPPVQVAVEALRDLVKTELDTVKSTLQEREAQQKSTLDEERRRLTEYVMSSTQQIETLTRILESKTKAPVPERAACVAVPTAMPVVSDENATNSDKESDAQSVIEHSEDAPVDDEEDEEEPMMGDTNFEAIVDQIQQYPLQPIAKAPWARSIFPHTTTSLTHQRELIVEAMHESLLARGITMELMKNTASIETKHKQLRQDRAESAEQYPYYLWMRDYLESQLRRVTKQVFVYDEKLAEAAVKDTDIGRGDQERHIRRHSMGTSQRRQSSSVPPGSTSRRGSESRRTPTAEARAEMAALRRRASSVNANASGRGSYPTAADFIQRFSASETRRQRAVSATERLSRPASPIRDRSNSRASSVNWQEDEESSSYSSSESSSNSSYSYSENEAAEQKPSSPVRRKLDAMRQFWTRSNAAPAPTSPHRHHHGHHYSSHRHASSSAPTSPGRRHTTNEAILRPPRLSQRAVSMSAGTSITTRLRDLVQRRPTAPSEEPRRTHRTSSSSTAKQDQSHSRRRSASPSRSVPEKPGFLEAAKNLFRRKEQVSPPEEHSRRHSKRHHHKKIHRHTEQGSETEESSYTESLSSEEEEPQPEPEREERKLPKKTMMQRLKGESSRPVISAPVLVQSSHPMVKRRGESVVRQKKENRNKSKQESEPVEAESEFEVSELSDKEDKTPTNSRPAPPQDKSEKVAAALSRRLNGFTPILKPPPAGRVVETSNNHEADNTETMSLDVSDILTSTSNSPARHKSNGNKNKISGEDFLSDEQAEANEF